MKELIAYLSRHKALALALPGVLISILLAAWLIPIPAGNSNTNPVSDGLVLHWGTLPGDSGAATGHSSGSVAIADPSPADPAADAGISQWEISDFAFVTSFCQAGKPYANIRLNFEGDGELLEKEAIPAMFPDADCVVSDFDEGAFTALITCTAAQGTWMVPILPYMEQDPLYVPFDACDGGEGSDEESAAPSRRERDCGDRKC